MFWKFRLEWNAQSIRNEVLRLPSGRIAGIIFHHSTRHLPHDPPNEAPPPPFGRGTNGTPRRQWRPSQRPIDLIVVLMIIYDGHSGRQMKAN